MEQESEKNPLLQHFYVYMQVLLSQALEPGFLEEVLNKKGLLSFEFSQTMNSQISACFKSGERIDSSVKSLDHLTDNRN